MSEQHDAPVKKSPPPAPPKPEKAAKPAKPPKQREGSTGAFLATLLAIGALGASYYLWQQQQVARKDTQALEKSIAHLLTVVEQKHQEQMESIDTLASHRHEQLEQRLQKIETLLPELRNLLGQKQGEWSLAEVEYLVRIANHRLQLMEDIPGAARALGEAARQLSLLDSVRFTAVIGRINQDIDTLSALNREGITTTATDITNLIQQSEQLPLALIATTTTAATQEAEPAAPVEQGEGRFAGLRQWGRQLWHDIKSLVTIRRSDEQPLLQPQQRYFIHESLRLKLETARLALLRRDAAIYQQALVEAGEWLQRYYDTGSSDVQSTIEEITRLSEVEPVTQLPTLEKILSLLQQVRSTAPVPPVVPNPPLEKSPILPPPVQPDENSATLYQSEPQLTPPAIETPLAPLPDTRPVPTMPPSEIMPAVPQPEETTPEAPAEKQQSLPADVPAVDMKP